MDNLTLSAALDMSYRPHCDWLQIEIRSECYKKAGGKSNKKPTPLVCGISIYKIFFSPTCEAIMYGCLEF